METLLDRGAEGDVAEAEAAIERLAAAPADDGLVIRDIWLLRLRALLARARGDDVAYRDLVGSLSRDGGIAWLRRTHRLGRGNDRRAGNSRQIDDSADAPASTPRQAYPCCARRRQCTRGGTVGSYRCKGRRSIGIA